MYTIDNITLSLLSLKKYNSLPNALNTDWHQDFVRTVECRSDGMEILSLGLKRKIYLALSLSEFCFKIPCRAAQSTLPEDNRPTQQRTIICSWGSRSVIQFRLPDMWVKNFEITLKSVKWPDNLNHKRKSGFVW